MSRLTYIGIDPGVATGFAVYNSYDKVFDKIETTNFWGCIGAIKGLFDDLGFGMVVVVEDPGLNKSIHWNQYPGVKGKSVNYACKIAQGVGMNKKEAALIIQFLKLNNIPHKAIKPTATKKDKVYFKRVTKYNGRTNQHERDAGMLVFGR